MCADIDKGYNPSTPEVKDPESAFYTRPKNVSFIELGLLKKIIFVIVNQFTIFNVCIWVNETTFQIE